MKSNINKDIIKHVSVCERGYHYPSKPEDYEECMPCPQGTYKNNNGNSTCIPCPEGTTTVANSAATSVDDCSGKLFKNSISANVNNFFTLYYLFVLYAWYLHIDLWKGLSMMSSLHE